jgi:hypothetical protein
MTRTLMIVETAGATELAVLQYAHSRICESTDFALLSAVRRDFYHRTSRDLIGAEHTELDADN